MATLEEALRALVRCDSTRSVVIVEDAADAVRIEGADVIVESQLANALQATPAPLVLVVGRVDATLLRLLRAHPVPLLVVTGSLDARARAGFERLDGVALLGPDAVVRVDASATAEALVFAPDGEELEGLCRAFDRRARLAISPTPRWLPKALTTSQTWTPTHGVAGYVSFDELDEHWVHWSRATSSPHVVVPVGVPPISQDELVPRSASLEGLVAAHTLERHTGPVFPAPRVVALVLERVAVPAKPGRSTEPSAHPPSGARQAFWAQARRALPMTGAVVGMERPPDDLPLDSPTAAFLAHRTLLRVQESWALRKRPLQLTQSDEDGMHRAVEVLRSAGQILTDQESKVVLRGFGLEVTRQAVSTSASGAVGFAERIGYPVVLKALSPDLRRRSDIGGVMLGLTTAAAVRRAYSTIVDNIEQQAPTARLDGVLVSEMLEDGLDIACGAVRLASGSIALHGRVVDASTPVEPVLAMSPLTPDDAMLLAHAVLTRAAVPAFRRQTDPDVRGLAELFVRVDRLLVHTGDRIESIDLGPVRLAPERGYVTLDARIVQRPHLEGV